MNRLRVLVTSDDGIRSPGTLALVSRLRSDGHEVFVVGSLEDMSGCGTSVGHRRAGTRIRYRSIVLRDDLVEVDAFEVDCTPVMSVMSVYRGGFGDRPDVVAVGINDGLNTGPRTLYSGTVGAALTAASYGGRAVAVSMPRGRGSPWLTAADLAAATCLWLAEQQPGVVINLNVPDKKLSELRGVRRASIAPASTGLARLVPDSAGQLTLRSQPSGVVLPDDCDTSLVSAGYATVTAMRAQFLPAVPDPVGSLERLVVLAGGPRADVSTGSDGGL